MGITVPRGTSQGQALGRISTIARHMPSATDFFSAGFGSPGRAMRITGTWYVDAEQFYKLL